MTDDVVAALHGRPLEILRMEFDRAKPAIDRNATTLVLHVVEPQGGTKTSLARSKGRNAGAAFLNQSVGYSAVVMFKGVSELSFSQLTANLSIHPEVVSMFDQGWEFARYAFKDLGNEILKFYFMEAEVIAPDARR